MKPGANNAITPELDPTSHNTPEKRLKSEIGKINENSTCNDQMQVDLTSKVSVFPLKPKAVSAGNLINRCLNPLKGAKSAYDLLFKKHVSTLYCPLHTANQPHIILVSLIGRTIIHFGCTGLEWKHQTTSKAQKTRNITRFHQITISPKLVQICKARRTGQEIFYF
eukprot:NODE_83_length_22457_cov_0.375794.p8 type:complete len:166 gc:universal NODE_83_length_22457_cov_0.375794:13486-13983(+)